MPAISTLLLIGAGYLGDFVAACCPSTCAVLAVRRRPAGAHGAHLTPLACDVTSATDLARELAPRVPAASVAAIVLLPPSALAAQELAVLEPLAALLRARAVVRVVVASSTGVYDGLATEVVTAATPITDITPRARRLLDIEHWWRAQGLPCRIVRLAGLYGPGRIIGRDAILAGRKLAGPAAGWLNLVRAEDAANALLAAVVSAQAAPVEVISDGCPLRREAYYASLAAALGRPLPAFDAALARGSGTRRIDPTASWQRLARQPAHVDARRGWPDLLDAARVTPG